MSGESGAVTHPIQNRRTLGQRQRNTDKRLATNRSAVTRTHAVHMEALGRLRRKGLKDQPSTLAASAYKV